MRCLCETLNTERGNENAVVTLKVNIFYVDYIYECIVYLIKI